MADFRGDSTAGDSLQFCNIVASGAAFPEAAREADRSQQLDGE